ncbi:MAG: hypothetical protein LQ340_003830 [Diploschistes diacapsis]|nr:MAG: hypothetical protein LQ340_003830 [Diploschistes diacapsis]
MDTGSTGLAISALDLGLKGADFSLYPKGTEYLSSSRRLWQGYWVPSNITFPADVGNVTAQVPILLVVRNGTCYNFTNGDCTDLRRAVEWPTGIKYMGVGFGRGSDEQPQALPDKVLFINVVSINCTKVDMHAGYIITQQGVQVGLTATNTAGFNVTKLDLSPQSLSLLDWKMVNMSIGIDNSTWNHGQALFDTGISQSYIRVDQATYDRTQTEFFNGHNVLKPGSRVSVIVGDVSSPIAYYNVVANDTENPLNPALGQYVLEKPSATKAPFINTGRSFYKGFDAMLDAECGWFGLRSNSAPQLESWVDVTQQKLEL